MMERMRWGHGGGCLFRCLLVCCVLWVDMVGRLCWNEDVVQVLVLLVRWTKRKRWSLIRYLSTNGTAKETSSSLALYQIDSLEHPRASRYGPT